MTSNALLKLNELLEQSKMDQKDLAVKLGISNSAISQWTKIPHNRISQMIDIFNINGDTVDILLGNQPLDFHYRTANRQELYKHSVSETIKQRTEFIYEMFVSHYMKECEYNFADLRKNFSSLDISKKESSFEAASIIRKEFKIPELRPITRDFIFNYILEELEVFAYYMPFKEIGLQEGGSDSQSAILFNKGNKYGILLDANRNVASAFFDLIHEVIHILLGNTFEKGDVLESFIDKLVGELVYPKAYLQKLFISPTSTSLRIGKTSEQVISVLTEKYNNDGTWCPRGLAKALVDCDMLTKEANLWKVLHDDFYEFYKTKVKKVSERGNINVNHSSYEEQIKLFSEVIEKNPSHYPVYIGLRRRLVNDEISPEDYADLFLMSVAHARLLKSVWSEKELIEGELGQWNK